MHFKTGSSVRVNTVDVTLKALGVDSASVSLAGTDGHRDAEHVLSSAPIDGLIF
jgi:hypothetical protein